MEAREVVLRPWITEQSMSLMDDKKYTFEVDVRANKTQVKYAIEEIFDVKVKNVNIANVRGKLKRQGRYAGMTKKRRKAVVALTDDSKEITIFEK
ncbi:50S ribosomal protein L23 [Loigolactobacillus coryniformis]|jgi:large subunit ribosomal protein L23|uniref:Large ribosomal subunit protein uL23 n=4 Tax=Loigolactobacillus coryniformis TaxID=1610 RepID=J3JB51_9LACO|nr:50S ribosomal protein L23 [Loigolactobacillus coryniformis]MDT3391268.1 50S ribosomal protein L23 [Bacillota bacterium]OEH89843.1 50S ribosomal protein L23 [Loigolactobacillus coryniformis subsp. coryniformis]RRG06069.1 MAG: 50S ribosomal protein L23 [Lactobacillus sp.]ATO42997.1 50S ribosomal protein L23 [Loigolactobacillus coryniformis subsp. torquens DSM 20004 = KCTC 3535]ATO54749.1 50S ribosomal protein L23 [Loigolactobacillus coryniformis subsp. coryniformis KCTC 3167 = DSM 20001]